MGQRTILPLVLLVGFGWLHYPASAQAQSKSRTSTQRLAWINIKGLWERKVRRLPNHSKDAPRQNVDIMVQLLDRAPKGQLDAELERIRNSSVRYTDMSDYDLSLLQAFVFRLRYRTEGGEYKLRNPEDKERIVYLLSGKCPRYIATVPIELFLTINSSENVLLLFDSHERSTNEGTQRIILEALSSGFRKLRREYKDDKEFLATSKEWFLANRAKLKVNSYYVPNGLAEKTRDLFLSS